MDFYPNTAAQGDRGCFDLKKTNKRTQGDSSSTLKNPGNKNIIFKPNNSVND